jgi:uncharacterized membrane protein
MWMLVGKWLFATLFVLGGGGHFVATDFYVKMMPPYLPLHRTLVLLSGIIEIILGILLLAPKTSRFAAWELIALLIAVLPANIHVFRHQVELLTNEIVGRLIGPEIAFDVPRRLTLLDPDLTWTHCS